MRLTSIYFFVSVLVGRNGLFSKSFDEHHARSKVPLKSFDDVDEYVCHDIGSNCSCSEECCKPAACIMTSWSPMKVCLVPGLKEEDPIQHIAANGPQRKDGVLYSGNIFSTAFHDFDADHSSNPTREFVKTTQSWNASDEGLDASSYPDRETSSTLQPCNATYELLNVLLSPDHEFLSTIRPLNATFVYLNDSLSPDLEYLSTMQTWNATYDDLNDSLSPDPVSWAIDLNWNKTDIDQINYFPHTDSDVRSRIRRCNATDTNNFTPFPHLKSPVKFRNTTGDNLMLAGVKEYIEGSINSSATNSSFSDQRTTDSSSLGNRSINTIQTALKNNSVENNTGLHIFFVNNKSNALLSKDLNNNFMKRFKFLIMKSTLKEATSQPSPSKVLDGFNKTIEDVLKSVKQLNERLNQLTYEKGDIKSKTGNSLNLKPSIVRILADSLSNSSFLPSPTVSIKISRKSSKWNVVKALFLQKRTNKTFGNSNTEMVVNGEEIMNEGKELEGLNNNKNGRKDRPVKVSIFRILGGLNSRKPTILSTVPTKTAQNGNFNTDYTNGASEMGIKEPNINQPIKKSLNNEPDGSQDVKDTEKYLRDDLFIVDAPNKDGVPSTPYDIDQNATFNLARDINSIANIMDSFSRWFLSPTESTDLKQSNENNRANENISTLGSTGQEVLQGGQCDSDLNLASSQNKAVKSALFQKNSDALAADYSDHSGSSVEYSENNEGLYNDSYVFIIKHRNKTSTKTESKWKRVRNFLHAVKLNPYRREKPVNSAKATDSETLTPNTPNLVQVTSDNNSSATCRPQLTIRIPESLMPEALEADQPKSTELLFSSSSYEEYGK